MLSYMDNMRTLDAVLWDLDGTIADTERIWVEAERQLVAEYAGRWTENLESRLVGATIDGAAAILHEQGVGTNSEDAASHLTKRVSALLGQELPWRPGALELLKSLRANNIQCVLVTMSAREQAMEAVDQIPAGTFSYVVSADDVHQPKPHPEPYLRGLDHLGLSAESCIAIEDSPMGADSAAAAGLRTVVVPQLLPVPSRDGRFIVETLTEVQVSDLRNLLEQPGPHPSPTRV